MKSGRVIAALALFWLAVLAGSGQAQPVRVFSGEHPGFSRLVIGFRQNVGWSFGKVEGGFEFRSDAGAARFQLDKVFDLIPRDRIRSLRDLGDGRLFLEVSCPCHAEVFELPRGQVVLDIKDGPPPAQARDFNKPLAPPGIVAVSPGIGSDSVPVLARAGVGMDERPGYDRTEIARDTPSATISPQESRRGLPLLPGLVRPLADLPDPAHDVAEALPAPVGAPPAMPSGASSATPVSESEVVQTRGDERVAEVERELLAQISRGAAQGLLEADVTIPKLPESEEQPEIRPESDGTPSPEEQETEKSIPTEAQRHVIIQTAIDEQFSEKAAPARLTEQGFRCPDDEDFAVASWGEDIGDGVDLGPYRSGLFGEFDTPQQDAILRLAKFYIFLTFGAEATNLLEKNETALGDVSRLKILADIMDRQFSSQAAEIAPFAECDGDVALWAVLSQRQLDPAYPVNDAAIVSAYSRLPIHLRRYLGENLIGRLIDAGRIDLAHSLRNALNRGEMGTSPELAHVEARFAMNDGNVGEAAKVLEGLVRDNVKTSPEALKELIELKLSQDISVGEEEISLAASFAFEHRGTELGADLRKLEVRAMGQSGRFAEAYAELTELTRRGELSLEERKELEVDLAAYLATRGTDTQFLRYLVPAVSDIRLRGEARLDVAERFLDLGFLPEAREVLGKSANVPSLQERKLLAKLAIEEGKFDVAIGYLTGLEDPEAVKLRVEALVGKKDYPAAIAALESAGENEKLFELAWRTGQWEEVTLQDSGEIGAIGVMLIEESRPPDIAGTTPSLELTSDLLARANKAREAVSGILERFPSL